MTIIPKRPITDIVLPLTLHTSTILADLMTGEGERFALVFGLDTSMATAFKERSCDKSDTELHAFTSDYERICVNGYEAWFAKKRFPFALFDQRGNLAAIIWFGPKELPYEGVVPTTPQVPWHTFAIRTYPPYRGKHLAFPFAEFVVRVHAQLFPKTPVWLRTDSQNSGAIRLYEKLGFTKNLSATGHETHVVMTRI